MVQKAERDSDIQLEAVMTWHGTGNHDLPVKRCEWRQRKGKGAEAPVTDLVSSKTYMTNFLSFRFEFQNLTMTLLMTIKEVYLANFLMMKKHRSN